ncbi:MAG: hypothetical protein M0Z42_10050, partial [Actinomycetota bacterium]|nr:hypothetical protein [Actinomycetota bacterium]
EPRHDTPRDSPPPDTPQHVDAVRGVTLPLLRWLPPAWRGQPVEVHDLPSTAGLVSYALRWHGQQPALLWEVTGEGPLTITAAGLDPYWVGAGRAGEALLGTAGTRW